MNQVLYFPTVSIQTGFTKLLTALRHSTRTYCKKKKQQNKTGDKVEIL